MTWWNQVVDRQTEGKTLMSRSRRRWLRQEGLSLLVAFLSCTAAAPVMAQRESESLSASFRRAVEGVLPAVVAIRCFDAAGPLVPVPPPLIRFGVGGMVPGIPALSIPVDRQANGSGVVIDAERGLVLTCKHVVQGAPRVGVLFSDGRERVADRIQHDPRSDLTLLTVDPQGLPTVQAQWGDSDTLKMGDWVLAIGRPTSGSKIVSAGIISGRGPLPVGETEDDLIATDAMINPSNCGGPLVNLDGLVVGINRAWGGPRDRFAGFGFAIPADHARRVAAELAEFGSVRRGYLGISIGPAQGETPNHLGRSGAVVINGVAEGSPAAEAGCRLGDVIVAIDGRPIANAGALFKAVENAMVGQELTLTIEREGRRQDIKVRTRPRPEATAVSGETTIPSFPEVGRRRRLPGGQRGRAPAPIQSNSASPELPRNDSPGRTLPVPDTSRPSQRPPNPAPPPGPDLPPQNADDRRSQTNQGKPSVEQPHPDQRVSGPGVPP
jgi:S1-C subfamily serine protease